MVNQRRFGINRICNLTGISKATYYTSRDPLDGFTAKYNHLKILVEKIIEKNPAYGIRRIKAELEQTGHLAVGRDTLAKLLKFWELGLKRKIKVKKPNFIQKILMALAGRANLLIRTKVTAPFQAITSDLTELVFKGSKAYFCVHKDAFGQMVYG